MSQQRNVWNSKLGFILAASGSAIGLGNIVFFSSNAYQYGGGAFYIPYFIALFVLGMPIMMIEFGLGSMTSRSFPMAMAQIAGKKGEFLGWWAIGCALFITMYYVAILGWAFGMMFGALGKLFESGATAPFAPFQTPSSEPSAMVYFFNQLTTWWPLVFIIIIWVLNVLILRNGTKSIERAVKIFVPLMWLFMIILVIRGVTLEGGFDGIMYLFTPDFRGISDASVWRGAFSQMFFSLSLGLGAMTTYASYLPKNADQVNNTMLVSFLNCGFEFIAGIAIFSLLFVFALNPAGTTLSLSFFVIPQGIFGLSASLWIVKIVGFLFFLLIVMAGLTSSISLIEGLAAPLIDKFRVTRGKALSIVAIPAAIGSCLFALPSIIDPQLSANGTLGLTLLDITDHWVFSYSLLTTGLVVSLIVGWYFGIDKLRTSINQHAKIKIGKWFNILVKFIIPIILLTVIIGSLLQESPLYGSSYEMGGYSWVAVFIPVFWIISTLGASYWITFKSGK